MPGETVLTVPCALRGAAIIDSARRNSQRMEGSSSDRDALQDGFEQREAVGGAEQGIDGPLGMRHHAEDVAGTVDDTRDVTHRAVRVVRLLGLERVGRVAKDDLALTLEPVERLLVRAVAPVAMGDREDDALPRFVARRELVVRRLDAKPDRRTHELERGVPKQCAWQEAGLARDLEAVTDTDHRRAAFGVLHYLAHD